MSVQLLQNIASNGKASTDPKLNYKGMGSACLTKGAVQVIIYSFPLNRWLRVETPYVLYG